MQRGIWKLGCLEAWMLGGAPEVEARAAALGGDETERCAAMGEALCKRRLVLPEWGNLRLRRFWPIRGRLPPAGLPVYLEITKDTKDTKSTTQRRAVRVREAHVRPEEPVGAWRASHATLWFLRSPPATAPSYWSYTSYMSYRDVLWHVADVPGVQGELLPAGAWGSAPHPPISQSAKIPFVSFVSFVISKYSGSSIAAFSNQLISQSARRSGRAPVSSWRTEKELQENKKTALRRPLWDGARGGTRTPTDLSTCTSSMRVCHFTTRAVKNGT